MNHETIWLSPLCEDECPEGRTWCKADPGPCDGCDAPSVKYIRADLVALIRAAALLPRLEAALAEGSVMVPGEPTEEMALAGLGALKEQLGDTSVIIRDPVFCWRAMVHAALIAAPVGEPEGRN